MQIKKKTVKRTKKTCDCNPNGQKLGVLKSALIIRISNHSNDLWLTFYDHFFLFVHSEKFQDADRQIQIGIILTIEKNLLQQQLDILTKQS